MGRGRRLKSDRISTGFLSGVLVPLLIFIGIYLVRYHEYPFATYLEHLWKLRLTFKILSLAGFANLLIFFYFYKLKMDKAAKGIIMGSLLYALLFLVFDVLL
jgi:hypothetical protein